MTRPSRSQVISSFTIIKGALLEETYAAFRSWDLDRSSTENLKAIKDSNRVGAKSVSWLRDVAKVISRRFEPAGRDRTLVELAQGDCDPEIWRPLVLWHMTRDEFLARDFLIHWLFPRFTDGTYRLKSEDVLPYLKGLGKKAELAAKWSTTTLERVATGLLRIAADFDLLQGKAVKQFTSFHLPEKSFLYLLHAIAGVEQNPRKVVNSVEWRMYLMQPDDVERELLRLHQYREIEYEAAGSLARLKLPCSSPAEYARRLVA
jgi:Putative inner membrane protein (DUF1819)